MGTAEAATTAGATGAEMTVEVADTMIVATTEGTSGAETTVAAAARVAMTTVAAAGSAAAQVAAATATEALRATPPSPARRGVVHVRRTAAGPSARAPADRTRQGTVIGFAHRKPVGNRGGEVPGGVEAVASGILR